MTTKAKWRTRSDAQFIENEIRTHAARVGLSPDHVLDLIDVSPPTGEGPFGVSPSTATAIERQVRSLALDRPDLVRDPAALKLSPREAHGHLMHLISTGRRREAEAFHRTHAATIDAAKEQIKRERMESDAAAAQSRMRINTLRDQFARVQGKLNATKLVLDHLERTGDWPPHLQMAGLKEQRLPPRPGDIQRWRDDYAMAGGELLDLQRRLDAAISEAPPEPADAA